MAPVFIGFASNLLACGGILDVGFDRSGVLDGSTEPSDAAAPLAPEQTTPSVVDEVTLPFDVSHPVVLVNDGAFDNWQGEYALLSIAAGLEITGLVVNRGGGWQNLNSNVQGWQALVDAAGASGIAGAPDPIASDGPSLLRPESGDLDDTVPNGSEGAKLLVEVSKRVDAETKPLVIVTGGRLTDVADAYLLDPSIRDRVVVVSSLGQLSDEGAAMGVPNGESDPWANEIVAQRLRYVQVSGFYDQTADVPAARLDELPDNALGTWIAEKQPRILSNPVASDQVSILAVALFGFVRNVERASFRTAAADGSDPPSLIRDERGSAWLVTDVDGELAATRFWELLRSTF